MEGCVDGPEWVEDVGAVWTCMARRQHGLSILCHLSWPASRAESKGMSVHNTVVWRCRQFADPNLQLPSTQSREAWRAVQVDLQVCLPGWDLTGKAISQKTSKQHTSIPACRLQSCSAIVTLGLVESPAFFDPSPDHVSLHCRWSRRPW